MKVLINIQELTKAIEFGKDLSDLNLKDDYFEHNHGVKVEHLSTPQAIQEYIRNHFTFRLPSVVAVIRNGKGDVLFLKRKSTDRTLPDVICLPGGKNEKDETDSIALRREVKEETQLHVTSAEHFYTGMNHRFTINFYTATVTSTDVIISFEHDGYEWVPLHEAILRPDLPPVTKEALQHLAVIESH